jgi:hypothetical protein
MAKRRVWSALTKAYRARLERKGIDQRQYESGASLKAARGHAKTPESLKEYARNPKKFPEYRAKRMPYAKIIEEKKARIFGDRFKFNKERSAIYVREGRGDVKPPTGKQLRFLAGLTDEEFDDWQYEHRFEDDWSFLWYR